MDTIDLHVHSTASDGSFSPTEVVQLAKEAGLRYFALTDHDTVKGVTEAIDASKNIPDLDVIPGIELSCYYDKREIHIVGLFVNYQDPVFLSGLLKLEKAREERNQKMVDNFVKDKTAAAPLLKPFTPDHIVYCGPYPLFVENIDQAKEALDAFMTENDKEPRLILVQGVGAFIMEDDKGKAAKAQLLAKDAIKLAVYAESFGGPLQMTDDITYFITHWEAEAYRSKK